MDRTANIEQSDFFDWNQFEGSTIDFKGKKWLLW